jgi:hypothetical protein
MVITGLWLVLPFIPIVESSTWAAATAAAPGYVNLVAALCLFSGVGYVVGGIRGHSQWTRASVWAGVGLFALILTMRVITIGWFPILWLYPLCLMLISAAVALSVRLRV